MQGSLRRYDEGPRRSGWTDGGLRWVVVLGVGVAALEYLNAHDVIAGDDLADTAGKRGGGEEQPRVTYPLLEQRLGIHVLSRVHLHVLTVRGVDAEVIRHHAAPFRVTTGFVYATVLPFMGPFFATKETSSSASVARTPVPAAASSASSSSVPL